MKKSSQPSIKAFFRPSPNSSQSSPARVREVADNPSTPTSSKPNRHKRTTLTFKDDSDDDNQTPRKKAATTKSRSEGGGDGPKKLSPKSSPIKEQNGSTEDRRTPRRAAARKRVYRVSSSEDEDRKGEPGVDFFDDDDDSEEEFKPSKKELESSEDEYSPTKEEIIAEKQDQDVEIFEEDEDDEELAESPPKKNQTKKSSQSRTPATPRSAKKIIGTPSNKSSPSVRDSLQDVNGDLNINNFKHLKEDWLRPEKIRDKDRRRPDHPDYNPRTLYVPDSFLSQQSPGHRQWWQIKMDHYDTILFFKVGKFYELYHMDAIIGVEEVDLKYMPGDFAHSGFPEVAYEKYKSLLVSKGHRVARIEQTETNEAKEIRVKGQRGQANVVRREICRIETPFSHDQDNMDDGPSQSILLAVTQLEKADGEKFINQFGICLIETTTSECQLGQFEDDRHCSRLRTLLAHHPPAAILLERRAVTKYTQEVIKGCLPSVDVLQSRFTEPEKVLKKLREEDYFGEGSELSDWPSTLAEMLDPNNSLGLAPKEEFRLALSALGAVIFELELCKIDKELVSMKLFSIYKPYDSEIVDSNNEDKTGPMTTGLPPKITKLPSHMILDSITMTNLDLLTSAYGYKGSLFAAINHTSTKFGERLLRSWLCNPLCDVNLINQRLDAVEDLQEFLRKRADAAQVLRKLPDLDRQLSIIHRNGTPLRQDHPDTRAVMFGDQIAKKKITTFIGIIDGFKAAAKFIEDLNNYASDFKSSLLKKLVTFESEGGRFPNLNAMLDRFEKSFDRRVAKETGKIIPNRGIDSDFDKTVEDCEAIQQELDQYLSRQKKFFNSNSVKFLHRGKNRYLIEVPLDASARANNNYKLEGKNKNSKHFSTRDATDLVKKLTMAEFEKENALDDILRRLFESFGKHYDKWSMAAKCLAMFDALMSLAKFSSGITYETCRPEFDQSSTVPFVSIECGRHATLISHRPDDFIPNDIELDEKLMMITGPNCGGKSTLMRQVGLMVILAQIGSYVPAIKCRLMPVDRVFTRLGASDRIVEGESTFYVECAETSSILRHATRNSLVLLDELGRGTSTYDGQAIAASVIKYISENVRCRTLFSTHYHSLVDEFASSDLVQSKHMACREESNELEEETKGDASITFLYKLANGPCPKSYGFNAARLAGMDDKLVRRGYAVSKQLEQRVLIMRTVQKIRNLGCRDLAAVRSLLNSFEPLKI